MARRIHRGLLERMPDMSPEIWLEVVSYLDPLDLLRLAKVSADLYLVLTSPTSNALWKAARRTVDCPALVTGLSGLALADLLYVNKCHLSFLFLLGFARHVTRNTLFLIARRILSPR